MVELPNWFELFVVVWVEDIVGSCGHDFAVYVFLRVRYRLVFGIRFLGVGCFCIF